MEALLAGSFCRRLDGRLALLAPGALALVVPGAEHIEHAADDDGHDDGRDGPEIGEAGKAGNIVAQPGDRHDRTAREHGGSTEKQSSAKHDCDFHVVEGAVDSATCVFSLAYARIWA